MSNQTNPDTGALLALVEQHGGEDFLRSLLGWALHQVMEAEVGEITGAGKGELAPEARETWRNGYRRRDWETRVGTIPLNIPKLREGNYLPSFLEPRRTSERAFAATVQEAYVNGVSTRSVDKLVQAMGASGVSKSQVSSLCEELDERVSAFRSQPIEGNWPYLWLDAAYLKSRRDRRITSRNYEFDLAVQERDRLTLIETVTPRGHSVSSKYVALSDVPSERNIRKIVAHDDGLPEEDIILLRNVATVARANDVSRMVAG